MQYILANASPRRKELLSQILEDFIVDPARGGEEVNLSLFPEDIARALAERKCDEVYHRHSGSTVIGCDTIVVCNGEILGKPADAAEATACQCAYSPFQRQGGRQALCCARSARREVWYARARSPRPG